MGIKPQFLAGDLLRLPKAALRRSDPHQNLPNSRISLPESICDFKSCNQRAIRPKTVRETASPPFLFQKPARPNQLQQSNKPHQSILHHKMNMLVPFSSTQIKRIKIPAKNINFSDKHSRTWRTHNFRKLNLFFSMILSSKSIIWYMKTNGRRGSTTWNHQTNQTSTFAKIHN